jgi:hypothetical protein
MSFPSKYRFLEFTHLLKKLRAQKPPELLELLELVELE